MQQNTLDFPLLERPFKADWPYLPLTLDPALAGDIDTVGVLDQLYSGLVSLGVGLDVMPEVANRWEILEEGLKYVFCLRKDVRWCDGTPLTAADFETAWKRVLDPALESPVASTLYDICGARAYHQGENPDPQSVAVQALDDHTLLVTLEQPTSYFLYLMTFSAAYPIPRHLLESKGASWADSENLVTNGPFELETWQQENDQDGTLSLVRNPAYQGRFSGNLQRVDLTALPTCEARLAAYENGQLDTLSFRNLSGDRDRIRQAHAGEYLSVPFLATTYLIFDATRPPLDDARLRQALVMAIDREQHADVNLNGFSFPALGGFVPPGMPGHSGEIGIPFDPERARGLLAESGFGVGHPQPEIEFLAGPDQESILNFLTEQWQNHLGISIPGKSADWETFVNRLEANPPHIFLNIWVNDYPDPDNFLRASKPLEWSRWQDANYQKLVETARQIPDQAQRMALYQQADQILVDAAVIVPFNYWRSHLLVNPEVKRYPTSAIKWWYFKDVVAE
ncbi:MAG TPA: hypothetical protein DEH25_07700 [Chloroflexi bacterium]|nr:hypothetical protein [Chloroflexota bacterium]